jgi:hypothetical protein
VYQLGRGGWQKDPEHLLLINSLISKFEFSFYDTFKK